MKINLKFLFTLFLFSVALTPRALADSSPDFNLLDIWHQGGVNGKDAISLSSAQELKDLNKIDDSITYKINGGTFGNEGWTANGQKDFIQVNINRSVPVVSASYSFEAKGFVPSTWDTDATGNPNDDLGTPPPAGVLGGFGTLGGHSDAEKRQCTNHEIAARFKLEKFASGGACGVYDNSDVARTFAYWAGSSGVTSTKFFCDAPFPPEPGGRDTWYRFEYSYGKKLSGGQAEQQQSDIELVIRGTLYRMNGSSATRIAESTTPLNWDLKDRSDMNASVGDIDGFGVPGITYRNLRIKLENAVQPYYYIPEFPVFKDGPQCKFAPDENDNDIYDVLSCADTQTVGTHRDGTDKVLYAQEDKRINNPNMNLRERNPRLIDPATFDLNPPPFFSIKLHWRLVPWYLAMQGVLPMPAVSVTTTSPTIEAGQSIDANALTSGFLGNQDAPYIAWCVDGVPNQGLAAGGRLITDTADNLASKYPSKDLDVVTDHRDAEDWNNNDDTSDDALRACCRLVKRKPSQDLDKDGMDDLWEAKYFPARIQDPTNVEQLRKVNPFDDSDGDGYDANLYTKRDGYFYWQGIDSGLFLVDSRLFAQYIRYYTEDWAPYLRTGQRPPADQVRMGVMPNVLATLQINGRLQTIVIKTGQCQQYARYGATGCHFPNIEEYIWGTDPVKADTNADGYTDGEQIAGKGASKISWTPDAKVGTKHVIRATSIGYSQQNLVEIDSSTTNYFVGKGDALRVTLAQTPSVITPIADVAFTAAVDNVQIDPHGLKYEWELDKQDGTPVSLGRSANGKGNMVLHIGKDALSALAIGGTGKLKLTVTEESTGKSGFVEQDVFMGDPATIEWNYTAGCVPSAPACAQSVGSVTAHAKVLTQDVTKLNFVWSINGVRQQQIGGAGEAGQSATINVTPLDKAASFTLGLVAYRLDTGDVAASVSTTVDINKGSSVVATAAGSPKTTAFFSALGDLLHSVQASVGALFGKLSKLISW